MNKQQENTFTMALGVERMLDSGSVKMAGLPALQKAFLVLKSILDTIKEMVQKSKEAMKGKTQEKHNAKDDLLDMQCLLHRRCLRMQPMNRILFWKQKPPSRAQHWKKSAIRN